MFHIHGGGWVAGDKRNVAGLEKYLAAGISVVSINYRYTTQAQLAGVKPPAETSSQTLSGTGRFQGYRQTLRERGLENPLLGKADQALP